MGKKDVPLDDWVATRDQMVNEEIAKRANDVPQKPLTAVHKRYLQLLETKTVIIATGPAGTGKTSLACDAGAKLFREQKVRRLVIARPMVQCDGDIGTLPGTIEEKTAIYLAPLTICLRKHFGEGLDKLLKSGTIEICPLEVMRGRTFHGSFVVLDEAENATYRQLRMLLTRIGHGSTFVVNGDISQSDLTHPDRCPLEEIYRKLKGHPQIGLVRMGKAEVLRPEIVSWIDEKLS